MKNVHLPLKLLLVLIIIASSSLDLIRSFTFELSSDSRTISKHSGIFQFQPSSSNIHRFQLHAATGTDNTDDDNGDSERISPLIFNDPFKFLGRGPDSIVRPGAVLVPPLHEYSHFLMKSAVFVFAMGYDSEGKGVIRCVSIDNPTAFTMEEMAQLQGELGQNMLFRGGDLGNESVMMLHSCGAISDEENCSEQIGTSGVYEGGIEAARKAIAEGEADPEWFKFFFNYIEFYDDELNKILEEVDSEGDAWMSLEVPQSFVLADHDKNEAWRALRNKVRQNNW